MASENLHARALFAVGHHVKLQQLLAASPQDPELLFLHRRALIAQGHAYLTSGAAAAAATEGQPGYRAVLESIDATPPSAPAGGAEFQAIRIVADYLAAGGMHVEGVLQRTLNSLAQLLADPVKAGNPRARVVAGEFYLAVGANDLAHAVIAPLAITDHNLDAGAVLISLFLRLDRPDLALALCTQLTAQNPNDAIVPQVLEARVHMAQGGARIQDALWAWEELVQTYAASAYLLTMMGTCHLLQNNWAEAARLFGEAAQVDSGAVPPEAHVNMVVATAAAGRADINTLSAMWTHFPHHPFTENLAAKAAAFDQAAAKYTSA